MPIICPACKKIYLKPQVDPETQLEIDMCPKCYGMWFDAEELSKFFLSGTLKRKFFLPEEAEPSQNVSFVLTTSARSCPRCKKPMAERLFGEVSIDICDHCQGLWLDDGELRRIVKEFEKGSRDVKTVASELGKGLNMKDERPSFNEVVKVILAFFGKS
jgi:Zn-finger nucleic acid-binding protein